MQFLRKAFDFFIFSSFYIALCSVIMVLQTNQLLHLHYNYQEYLLFVFFSTICSYNFHWFLTPHATSENDRSAWTQKHKSLHVFLFFASGMAAAWFFLSFINNWLWMLLPVVLTFLYSAPKIPHPLFGLLRKVAIGKTLYLSLVWTYVTAVLPIILDHGIISTAAILFCLSRFLLIYAICILFDYRDRENDRRQRIRSMITYLSEHGVNILFYISLFLFLIATVLLFWFNFSFVVIVFLLIPGLILLGLFKIAKRNFSDYLYYFVLDGLMMLSSILTFFLLF